MPEPIGSGGVQRFDHVIDAGRVGLDISQRHCREEPDAQLVATELAVGIRVDDATRAQLGIDGIGIHAFRHVDGRHHQRPSGRVGDERSGASLDYVPGRGEKKASLVFSQTDKPDPALRVLGWSEP